MHLNEMASPDTAAAVAANQVARRYCSSALYAHSVRSYLWGVAYARRAGPGVSTASCSTSRRCCTTSA